MGHQSISLTTKKKRGADRYAKRLNHGEIGKGLNNYGTKFKELKRVNFSGWISIEDGVDGMDQLERSVPFFETQDERILVR